ncbi:hypothetical protein LZ578_08555 [Jeotgalibaca sp. MA1X17-3]|uniref:hypothetical protein n=1 Tax=Jeotgalibaca sp. MA1X17-3 TaxID=2908211 RepID=UPI001F4013FC|nr:hypothetical protein [Jeotgalibaca sp. MA1X17-3]UJF15049.1 hypothetical protein LZ578_08555 [Jeotgalibaca sp. MA1X17-3]
MENNQESNITILKNDFLTSQGPLSKLTINPNATQNEPIKIEEEKNMPQSYVTEKDLERLEDKIDLKIKVAIQPLEGKIDTLQTTLNGKFETMEEKMKNLFLEQKIELQKERKENIKWIVGTGIAIVSVIIAYFSIV